MVKAGININKIFSDIEKIRGARVIGTINAPKKKYPFYQIKIGRGEKVLISGGIHGDEPAGVFAVLSFFERHATRYLDRFEFMAFPCVNPYGLENNTRGNAENLNLNREFKKDTLSQETKLIMEALEDYLFTMDFHETWVNSSCVGDDEPEGEDPEEFYLWEICENRPLRIGHRIIQEIEKEGFSVCKWPKIYGDINNNGVIWYPEGLGSEYYARNILFDQYLYKNHTGQAFTIETPRRWDLKRRVRAHLISLLTALDEINRGSQNPCFLFIPSQLKGLALLTKEC